MRCPEKYKKYGDFIDYYKGKKIAPVTTIFIGGNHEASNHLWQLYNGGWVCDNIYFMGYSGVINYGGLRIAGISGIYNNKTYCRDYSEQNMDNLDYNLVKNPYHYRKFEVEKLLKVLKN